MLTVIFRASSRPDVGATIHQPTDEIRVPIDSTVVTAVCGAVGIGPVLERPEITCALCLAMTGHHPGKRGKSFLHHQYLASRSPR